MTSVASVHPVDPPLLLSWRFLPFFPCEGFFSISWEFFLIRCEVKGQGCRLCTDCKALWGNFVICDVLYKMNWIEYTHTHTASSKQGEKSEVDILIITLIFGFINLCNFWWWAIQNKLNWISSSNITNWVSVVTFPEMLYYAPITPKRVVSKTIVLPWYLFDARFQFSRLFNRTTRLSHLPQAANQNRARGGRFPL